MHVGYIRFLAGLLMMATLAHAPVAVAGALDTDQQREKEQLVLRILKSGPMQEQIKKTEAIYRSDPAAKTPSGEATLVSAANSFATVAAQYAANDDRDRPAVMWGTTSEHEWFGYTFPRSYFAIDAPDNVYRSIPIDGAARYEIRGKINAPGPVQQTYVLYNGIPGLTPMDQEGHMLEAAGLQSTDLTVGGDGTFTISVDSDPANGRPNHMQSREDNRHMELLIRNTLADWTTQNPVYLEIERVSGPLLRPAPTDAELAQHAAKVLAGMTTFWRDWYNTRVYAIPTNHIETPWTRKSGYGFNAFGNFTIADDEAWVVTMAPLGAGYMGFQVTDPWGAACESRSATGSFNQNQSKANADGTYTYVVAAKDPGVYNWLDTGGLHVGTYTLRWQELPKDVPSPEGAVRSFQVVKLKDLKSVLSAETVFITPEERKVQQVERAASYDRRMAH